MNLRVLVASDHSIVREGLVRLLNAEPAFTVEGCGLGERPKAGARADVVICVAGVNPEIGAVLSELSVTYTNAKILCLLLAQDDATALNALRSGALGVVDQTVGAAELIESIRQLAEGEFVISNDLARRLARLHGAKPAAVRAPSSESELTQREAEVLKLLAEGYINRDIAAQLSLSEHTVRAHLRGVMQKLHVSNRVQAAALAWQGQLVNKTVREDRRHNGNTGG